MLTIIFCRMYLYQYIYWPFLNKMKYHTYLGNIQRFYMAPSLLSIWSFWRLSFFWETFFFSGSSAEALEKACSFSTKVNSMWHGELMYGLIRPWARYVRLRIFGARFTWRMMEYDNVCCENFIAREIKCQPIAICS